MKKLLISVIVPVYNVEKYLNRCIESIISQTYENLEIILVDDGSPDKCPIICDKYAEIDNRIKVIHKENGGLSDARNTGINNATGDYIIFIDSDDYWDECDSISEIVKQLEVTKPDVLIFGYKKFYEENKKYSKNKFSCDRNKLLSSENQFEYLIKNRCYESSSWNKVIKKTLFDNYDLSFRKGLLSEDIEWSAKLAMFAKSYDYFDKSFLVYVQRQNSITKTPSLKHVNDIFKNVKLCLRMVDDYQIINHKIIVPFKEYIAFQYSTLLIKLGDPRVKYTKDIFDEVKKYSFILKKTSDKRIRLINIINGLKITSKLLFVYYKVR